uniref:Uncharacterized protein n=1 Tax=Pyramimonas obovata TaxID=1411642 RepID=A0A7S0WSL2_9CHLO|mmetsp:Transcript_3784/g.7808  ORF Transcript_3784/g.7808 Transcript_3784/m.7808 type:complete len:234 (+) Transcript_3784:155-856(+)|eukprot:CAMPEP_0118933700 /NCGR_PEP_ID=MMETSP1169-20130426/12200_1 /TAXON_ID=36882 /ORGANISM="Pyramimonas obovata, Strain CCMP722" /LENGTH=233 /DNA_ID=CAMNT_0006876497 /DNA_START=147 /DNA_END=848 /DNA_ORIENTATION=-
MTSFEQSDPLCVLRPVFEGKEMGMPVQLDEALIGGPDLRNMLALCMYSNVTTELARKFRDPRLLAVDQHVHDLGASFGPYADGDSVLQTSKVINLFPDLDAMLRTGQANPSRSEKQAGMDYFAQMTVWNQLLTMTKQLHHDAEHAINHKYIAHQIALLYQCLNHARGEFKSFKRDIEAEFDKIKTLTESSSAPQLSLEQRKWLQGVTSKIMELLHSVPPSMQQQIKPMATIVA